DARFAEKIIFRNITPADIPFAPGEEIDFITLNKFAIDYADGVIAGSENVDQSLIDYAKEKGKLFLPYQPEDTRNDAIDQFYEQVWNNNNQ
ncbi:MAG: glycogen synthase, partial [Muribaculaceae bacterium]|nr:glycogen synthase [Muribaculaceae bacterium]